MNENECRFCEAMHKSGTCIQYQIPGATVWVMACKQHFLELIGLGEKHG